MRRALELAAARSGVELVTVRVDNRFEVYGAIYILAEVVVDVGDFL